MLSTEPQQACIRTVLDAVFYVDSQQFEKFAACFSNTGELFRPGQAEPLKGRGAILAAYESRPATRTTRHVCSNMRVDLLSETEAVVHSYVQLYAKDSAADGPDDAPALKIGEFEDHCVFEDGRWLIRQRKASFVL